MPSERELAARYSVGISTVRAAIGELVSSNVLIRMQGKGTYIAHHSAPQNRYRFFNVVREDGVKRPFNRQLMSLKREKADAKIGATLQLPSAGSAAEVIRARIRLRADTAPVAVADLAVPVRLFRGLDVNGMPDGEGSLYSIYQAAYDVNIIKVIDKLAAVMPLAAVARALDLSSNEPVLEVRRVAFTFNDVPVEVRTTWVHTRHYHYLITHGGG